MALNQIAMKFSDTSKSKYLWSIATVLSLLVYAVGMLVTIMEIDGAVYAEISREMEKMEITWSFSLKARIGLINLIFNFG